MDSRNIYSVILALLITQFVSAQGIVKTGVYTWADSATFLSHVRLAAGAHNGYVLTSDSNGNTTWKPVTNTAWGLTGNAGTNPATNFVGTIDENNLTIRYDNYTVGQFGTVGHASNGQGLTIKDSSGNNLMYAVGNADGYMKAGFGDLDGSFNATTVVVSDGDKTIISNDSLFENNGKFKLVDGTQANGYVLTSDASGNASWQTPSAGSLQTATVTIPADSILNMFSAPNTLVPAKGANTMIVPTNITYSLIYGTSTYATNTSLKVSLGVHNINTNSNFLGNTSSALYQNATTAIGGESGSLTVVNTPLLIQVTGGNPTVSGTGGTLKVTVLYYVVNLN